VFRRTSVIKMEVAAIREATVYRQNAINAAKLSCVRMHDVWECIRVFWEVIITSITDFDLNIEDGVQ